MAIYVYGIGSDYINLKRKVDEINGKFKVEIVKNFSEEQRLDAITKKLNETINLGNRKTFLYSLEEFIIKCNGGEVDLNRKFIAYLDVEFIEIKEVKPKYKPKVGDIVRINSPCHLDGNIRLIIKIYSNCQVQVNGHVGVLNNTEVEKLSNSELILYLMFRAEMRYPIGTFYYCADSNVIEEVKDKLTFYEEEGVMQITDDNGGYVYYNGNWAEIEEFPKIGCSVGKFCGDEHIKYGDLEIKKSFIVDMFELNITHVVIHYQSEYIQIPYEVLKKLYKLCKY